jgi:hypothetical protein
LGCWRFANLVDDAQKKATPVIKQAQSQAATEAANINFVPDMTTDKDLYQQDLKQCK